MVFWQAGKLQGSIEREDKLFWWLPWLERRIMESEFWQDHHNCYWHCSAGWLWWSTEFVWQKTFSGWRQLRNGERHPWLYLDWSEN